MVLITGGLSRTAALCCHRPKHTPASLQITLPSSLYPLALSLLSRPLLLSLQPCTPCTLLALCLPFSILLVLQTQRLHLDLLRAGIDCCNRGLWIDGVAPKRRQGENRTRRMDGICGISYSLVSANWRRSGNLWNCLVAEYLAAESCDSIESSVNLRIDNPLVSSLR